MQILCWGFPSPIVCSIRRFLCMCGSEKAYIPLFPPEGVSSDLSSESFSATHTWIYDVSKHQIFQNISGDMLEVSIVPVNVVGGILSNPHSQRECILPSLHHICISRLPSVAPESMWAPYHLSPDSTLTDLKATPPRLSTWWFIHVQMQDLTHTIC